MGDNENIIPFPGITYMTEEEDNNIQLKAEAVLNGAIENGVIDCLVIGRDVDGEFYFAGTMTSMGKMLLYIEKAKQIIVDQV